MDIRLGSLNVVILEGRLCADVELRYTPSGAAVLGFRLAVDRRYQDKTTQEWKSEPSFFQCNVWGQQAERLSKSLHKGSPVLVEGSLRSRNWEDKEGNKRYAVEVFCNRVQNLEKRPSGGAEQPQEPEPPEVSLDDLLPQ